MNDNIKQELLDFLSEDKTRIESYIKTNEKLNEDYSELVILFSHLYITLNEEQREELLKLTPKNKMLIVRTALKIHNEGV